MMTTKSVAWGLIGISLFAIGCSGGDSGTAASSGTAQSTTGTSDTAKKYKIAVIPKGSTHEFWKSVHAGADEAGKELGVEIVWQGPNKENDRDMQIKVVEDMTNQGVDGIVLAPLDDTALKVPVENAKKQGIPVLIIDSDLKDTDVVSFVATDNEKGGAAAGEEMVRLLGGKGKIVVLRYDTGSASTTFREKGFLDAVKKSPGIQVVSENQFAGPTVESAQTKAENLLSGFKKADGSLDVDGIFCPNESSTFGMLRVLEDNKWASKVKFVGFDASTKLVEGLQKGEINALVVQNPRKMGYEGVKSIVDYLNKKAVTKRIDTGAMLVTKENMTSPDVAKVLETPK
jgi:ribose transport system substrate-binding protein